MNKLFTVILILACCTSGVHAANPLDVSLFYRIPKAGCIKFSDDVDAKSIFMAKPIDKNFSIMYYDWNSENGKKLNECGLTVRASKSTQVGIIVDDWMKADDKVSLMLDMTKGTTSLALLIPSENPEKAMVGIRQKVGNDFTAYAKLCQGSKPGIGISYSTKEITIDYAHAPGMESVRVSKTLDRFTPELRVRFTPSENFWGGAVTFKLD